MVSASFHTFDLRILLGVADIAGMIRLTTENSIQSIRFFQSART